MFGINGQPFLYSGKGFFGQNGCSLSARATPKMTQSHTQNGKATRHSRFFFLLLCRKCNT